MEATERRERITAEIVTRTGIDEAMIEWLLSSGGYCGTPIGKHLPLRRARLTDCGEPGIAGQSWGASRKRRETSTQA